jgi:hypothetical protein
MAGSKSDSRHQAAWTLAESQQGLVTRRQLLTLGFSTSAIDHRVALGRLHPIMRGVYAVGWRRLTPKRRWMAAVLGCGEGAVLSHRSAAALWGFAVERGPVVEISARKPRSEPRRSGIEARGRPSLPDEDVTSRDGIPVTTPARTLLDLATLLTARQLERAVNEADKRDLVDPVELRRALAGYAGEPGVRALRHLLDRDTFQLSDSDLEIYFRPIAARAGLPPPLAKQFVNGFEVDFQWPELGLVIETDGLRYHRTPAAQARDRIRDQAHTAAGLTPLRFTHWQVKNEPAYVADILMRTARRLGP